MTFLCREKRPMIAWKQNGFDLASLFPRPYWLYLKDIIAVKSDYRTDPALQKADTLSAAPKGLQVFVGDVL